MELPNVHFQDYPIEFKEINPEDFPHFEVENNREKHIISPNDDGYINDSLQGLVNINHKNTTVINAAVGQGKSFAIIQTIKRYYEADEDYLIVVASPFVSLVTQYCNDIRDAGIPEEQVYNYGDLGRNPDVTYIGKAVQVVTVNTLLGNPGEDGFKNSDIKRSYINNLIELCKNTNTRVVFIYDEIHDSYYNFKEEYIFNLWKWREVIHKNFILSASYNEASKVVIEYLAELTDKKIKIIESKRVVFPEKQSDLYLHFNSAQQYRYNNDHMVSVISDIVNRGKDVDILCYSKTLAHDFINTKDSEVRIILLEKYGEINNCTSELVSNQRTENRAPQNRFDKTKCNIGTNFKTGVSIKKENHALVVIMPPSGTRLWFKNKSGIFSGGINSVIQALARQRTKGEIHIILPNPDKFDFTSLNTSSMSDSQKESFKKYYSSVQNYKTPDKFVKYLPLNMQDHLLHTFYENELKGNVSNEIEHAEREDRTRLARLNYPTYKLFKLDKGEDYLANVYPYFGGDISAYTTYSAFTNQLVNCRLKGVINRPVVYVIKGKEQESLHKFFDEYLGEHYYYGLMEWSNHRMIYLDFKHQLFNSFTVGYYDEEKKTFTEVKRGAFKILEQHILKFIHNKVVKKVSVLQEEDSCHLIDGELYSRSAYFLQCIAHSKEVNFEEENYSEVDKKRIKTFQLLNYFREKLINQIAYHDSRGKKYYYLPSTVLEGFLTTEEYSMLLEMISLLRESDELIANNIFEFAHRITKNETVESKINSFYKILLEDFVLLDNASGISRITTTSGRMRVKKVLGVNIIPTTNYTLDLITPAEHHYPVKETEEWAIQNYGSYELYNDMLNTALDSIED
jgi:hypothetical protein